MDIVKADASAVLFCSVYLDVCVCGCVTVSMSWSLYNGAKGVPFFVWLSAVNNEPKVYKKSVNEVCTNSLNVFTSLL